MAWVVHKFGGASVRDAAGVINLGEILSVRRNGQDQGLDQAVVVSAMGKTTNALEEVWRGLADVEDVHALIEPVIGSHVQVAQELNLPEEILAPDLDSFRTVAKSWVGKPPTDGSYDALVGFGERWSTRIVAAHLREQGTPSDWVSAWTLIRTNACHRAAAVNLEGTQQAISEAAKSWAGTVPVTQGFVGSSADGWPTTLGREGSDFSGALLAESLGAKKFCVWKDVPGVMTGDPRTWPAADFIPRLDHTTAEIMSEAGAGVLHPATMAPLRRGKIPLLVKSFKDPSAKGTRVDGDVPPSDLPPLWTMSQVSGQQWHVRCIGATEDLARHMWLEQFPKSRVDHAERDAKLPGCILLHVTH